MSPTSSRLARLARLLPWLVAIATVLFGWLVESPFVLMLTAYTFAFALFALSINIMLGGIGEVPLGQCLFFGIGAYGAGIGMSHLGLPFGLSILLAMAVSVAAAWLIGSLTLKLTGAYFSIVSWGLSGVALVAALNLDKLTGGPLGMFGFTALQIGPIDLTTPRGYYFVTATALAVVLVLLASMRRSRFGFALESLRQNRHLAQSIGIDVVRQRMKAFLLSAPIAALAGALCMPYTQIITPEIFSVGNTVDALLMVLLGGTQLLTGPVIGAVVFTIIPYYLELDPNVRILVFSVAIILIMMFAPGGLHQIALAIARRFGRRPADSHSPLPASSGAAAAGVTDRVTGADPAIGPNEAIDVR